MSLKRLNKICVKFDTRYTKLEDKLSKNHEKKESYFYNIQIYNNIYTKK